MSKADTPEWLSKPLTDDEIAQCRKAGASEDFLTILRTDCPPDVNRHSGEQPSGVRLHDDSNVVSRHSVRIEVKKQLREWDNDPADMTALAGDFFTHLWNGNTHRYRGHADANNSRLLALAGLD